MSSKSNSKRKAKEQTQALVKSSGNTATPSTGEWEWTELKTKCLNLSLSGIPKVAIAQATGKHRNTINKWCAHPVFIAEASKRNREHAAALRQRRHMQTATINDKIYNMATKAVDAASVKDAKPQSIQNMRMWLSEYKSLRAEERMDLGDNVRRIETIGTMDVSVTGEVNVSKGSNDTTFHDFLLASMESGVIEPELLEGVESTELISEAMQIAMLDGAILDIIDEEDTEDQFG